MFKFDYELIDGQTIRAVAGTEPNSDSGEFSCDLIALEVGDHSVVISVNIDTDEIVVELDDGNLALNHNPYEHGFRDRLVDIDPTLKLVGKTLAWGWEIKNYRGYNDGILIATGEFVPDAIQPALAFIGEASSISVSRIEPLRLTPQETPNS